MAKARIPVATSAIIAHTLLLSRPSGLRGGGSLFYLPPQKIPGTGNVSLFAVCRFAVLKLSCEHENSLREAEFHFISHALFTFIGLSSHEDAGFLHQYTTFHVS